MFKKMFIWYFILILGVFLFIISFICEQNNIIEGKGKKRMKKISKSLKKNAKKKSNRGINNKRNNNRKNYENKNEKSNKKNKKKPKKSIDVKKDKIEKYQEIAFSNNAFQISYLL